MAKILGLTDLDIKVVAGREGKTAKKLKRW